MKACLISVDGVRPDALISDSAKRILSKTTHTLSARTVIPPYTLPCHMSMFTSVDPDRHGTLINTYMPQMRPVNGLCEVLSANKKSCARFFDWEELRDTTRPGSLDMSFYCKGAAKGFEESTNFVLDAAHRYIRQDKYDFVFVYMAYPDEMGHGYGWMSEKYLEAVEHCCKHIEGLIEEFGDEYIFLITADHGGHDRMHGYDIPEDMTIPIAIYDKKKAHSYVMENVSIKDLAPTVAELLGCPVDPVWEGKSLIKG